MAALVPAIHAFVLPDGVMVDARDKPEHDGTWSDEPGERS